MIEIEEVLYQWLKGVSIKGISRSLGLSRNTVKKHILQAQSVGLTKSSHVEEIKGIRHLLKVSPKIPLGPVQSYLSNHHLQIEAWHQMPHMTVSQMGRLFKEKGKCVSETSLHRYIKKHFPSLKSSTVHLETTPGRQAQVDFCYVGLMVDPSSQKARKAYAFIMNLSHSRYRFVRFVFRQDVATWIDCHIRAFHFGGVPETVMLDNLKAGVVKADIYDPTFNRTYGELERH